MIPVDMLKQYFSDNVPFASHSGIQLTDISEGKGVALLPDEDTTKNHIGTQHAGALFTLGEVASGGAAVSALFPVMLTTKPVVTDAQIKFEGAARGAITAEARLPMEASEILAKLQTEDKVSFTVPVEMTNQDGKKVCSMSVEWFVSK